MARSIHAIDLLEWFVGMPSEVFSWSTRRVHTGIESEDTATASLRFPSGALGTIEGSTAVWPGWQRRLEICGEHGSIALEDDDITHWSFRELRPGDDGVRATKDTGALGSGASAPNSISYVGHQRQIQDLMDALHEGRAPALDGREGRKAVVLVRALYASAERGASVNLAGGRDGEHAAFLADNTSRLVEEWTRSRQWGLDRSPPPECVDACPRRY